MDSINNLPGTPRDSTAASAGLQILILAGGSGTRFWPLSRRRRPKQLLALDGDTSLLRQTIERLAPLVEPADVWICTTDELAAAVRAELPEVPAEQVLVEPHGRNTAPAIGWSLHCMPLEKRRGLVAVLPADHHFSTPADLRDALDQAAAVAGREDRVMTLGVVPRWAETGYGYLELGEMLEDGEGDRGPVHQVARFTEKPEAATAERYYRGERHLWNAGIFVFRGTTLLEHLARLAPAVAEGLEEIAENPERSAELYPELPSISIDYAVMERLDSIATVPLDGGWNDLGSWQALCEIIAADDNGNHRRGDTLTIDAHDNLLYADEGTVAVLGVDHLVVVRTGDSVLVLPRERSQEVRRLVDALAERGREELL